MRAIVDCADALFTYYAENMHGVWLEIREVCMDLLSADAFGKFQELCDLYVFDTEGDENCRDDWGSLIEKCDSEDEEIPLSNQ